MKTNWALIAMIVSFTFMLSLNTHSYAFHENLGIDDNKASELYQTKPNDPAILRWKNALQSAISGMDKCFTILGAISCQSLIPLIVSNCNSHPNTLLACNDARLPQYPSILKNAEEIKKLEDQAMLNASDAYSRYSGCLENRTTTFDECKRILVNAGVLSEKP